MALPTHRAAPLRGPKRGLSRLLALALAFVVFVLLPLSLLVSELEIAHLQPVQRAFQSFTGHTSDSSIRCVDVDSMDDCVRPLLALGQPPTLTAGVELYPEAIFQVDWSKHATRDDALHLSELQRGCLIHKDSAIPWNYGLGGATDAVLVNRTDDQALVEALRKCPSIDVFIPSGIRGHGYCEDAAVYTKYLHARMLPPWVFDGEFYDETVKRKVSYHELCPRTPILMLNHYWEGLREKGDWPATKPIFLMPNIEMFELGANHFWQADVVLCKTVICAEYVSKWYAQEGNPRLSRVLFTRHTTSDVATYALMKSGVETTDSNWQHLRRIKNFEDVKFIHTAGSSTQKGTGRVMDCWLSRPDLPKLDIHMSEELYNRLFRKNYDEKIKALDSNSSANMKVHLGKLDAVEFGTMIADASFFLCTSHMEGYGHYINQARASGGLIISPNVPPMNELITPASGVLVDSGRAYFSRQFFGGHSKDSLGLKDVSSFVASFNGDDVCAAVDKVLKEMDERQRRQRAQRARQQYLYDTAFFAWKMDELRRQLQPKGDDAPPQ